MASATLALYAALCSDDLSGCFPAVRSGTRRCHDYPALVWRLGSGVEHMSVVFPARVTAGLPVRARPGTAASSENAGGATHHTARRQFHSPAYSARRQLEALRTGRPSAPYPAASRRHDRSALLSPFRYQPTVASLACGGTPRSRALSALRALERRLDAGLAELPRSGGAFLFDAPPGEGLVSGLYKLGPALW